MHVRTSPLPNTRQTSHAGQFGRCDDRSGLERAADSTARVRPGQPAILASLLLAGLPRRVPDDNEVLWPLWASEAVYRAEGLLTLLALLDRSRRDGATRLGQHLDIDLARALGSNYQALQEGQARAPSPCSVILRDTAAGLVSLFGEVTGLPLLRTDIARLVLPGFQRRALVLAASTLVIGALIHGGEAPGTDLIDMALHHDEHVARLRLTARDPVWPIGPALVAASAMADLLGGALQLKNEGRRAEIAFLVPAPTNDWEHDGHFGVAGAECPDR